MRLPYKEIYGVSFCCSAALEDIEIAPVAIAVPITPLLLVGLSDGYGSEFYRDFTIKNSLLSRRLILEVYDSEAAIANRVPHLLHGHEATLDWAELLHDGLAEELLGDRAWDLRQPDAFGIWNLLFLLLILHSFPGLEGLCIESALLWACNSRVLVLLVVLHFLQVFDLLRKVRDLGALDIVSFARVLSVSDLGSQVLFLRLDFKVRMPDIVSMEHSDVSVASDGFVASTDSKRVENWVLLLSLGVGLRHGSLRLQNTAVKVLDDGTSVPELNFLHSFPDIGHLR